MTTEISPSLSRASSSSRSIRATHRCSRRFMVSRSAATTAMAAGGARSPRTAAAPSAKVSSSATSVVRPRSSFQAHSVAQREQVREAEKGEGEHDRSRQRGEPAADPAEEARQRKGPEARDAPLGFLASVPNPARAPGAARLQARLRAAERARGHPCLRIIPVPSQAKPRSVERVIADRLAVGEIRSARARHVFG